MGVKGIIPIIIAVANTIAQQHMVVMVIIIINGNSNMVLRLHTAADTDNGMQTQVDMEITAADITE